MADHVARNDAQIVRQVVTLTPVVVNANTYGVTINGKHSSLYTADGSATAQEIVEGVQAILDAYTAAQFPEASEITWTENDTTLVATGPTDGKPITVLDSATGTGDLTPAATTAAKSPNHWIAENFDSGSLPASTDTVYITQLGTAQSFYWGLDQNAVNLAALHVKADSEAYIGLPEYNTDTGTQYFQGDYRDTHLKISAVLLTIGDGAGNGSGRVKIDLGAANDCNATIYKTGQKVDQDEAAVHLVGGTSSSSLQVLGGTVDLAMLPGYTGSWGTIVVNGGTVRAGTGVTLATVELAGGSLETRSAIVTLTLRSGTTLRHIGSGNVTTSNVLGKLEITATAALTITTLNGYSGGSLDLSKCDSLVTVTNMNIYASPAAPFTINDPNNKLSMTNPASCFNGVQSLSILSGSARNLRVT